VKSEHHLHSG